MPAPDYLISTPENVDLHLEFAGIGNRILACLLDTLVSYLCIGILIAFCVLTIYLGSKLPIPWPATRVILGVVVAVSTFVACFIVYFGYFIYFEGNWQGQTPGKKIAGIRVIEQNGQPVSWSSVWLRNLVRILDEGLILIGLISMIVDNNERRLGDLAANTIVIRERGTNLSTGDLNLTAKLSVDDSFDVGRITLADYDLLLTFFRRRKYLDPSQRPLIASKLAEYCANKLGTTLDGKIPEIFLEKLLLSYQSRAL